MKITVLGAGPGGYVAAIRAAQRGASVTVVEDDEVGGTCLNWGCIPTKALVASATLLEKTKRSKEYGLELNGEILPDIRKIIDRKNRIVRTQVKGIRGLFQGRGIRLVHGRGVIKSLHKVRVTDNNGSEETIDTDKIIIATGSRPSVLPALPFNGKTVISSNDAVHLREIPGKVLIVGAGAIGCEFAFIYRAFGSDVTVVERMRNAVPNMDSEISGLLEREMKKYRIRLLTGVHVEKVDMHADSVSAKLSDGSVVDAQVILVSTGRTLNSSGMGLDNIGVQTGEGDRILVNDRMETSAAGVYAVGDVTGGMMLAHVASREGSVAALNATGSEVKMRYGAVPSAVYTRPEAAAVGFTEKQAMDSGLRIGVGRFQFRSLGMAHAAGEIAGLVKIITENESGRILGTHIIGPHASELIHEAALAMEKGLSAHDIANTIHAHPAMSEALLEAAEDVHDRSVHTLPKGLQKD